MVQVKFLPISIHLSEEFCDVDAGRNTRVMRKKFRLDSEC